jgi:Uma2 family endonuclease
VVELLSPGTTNVRRDRETKRTLYSRRGVQEYWIVDWILRRVEVYRREDAMLQIVATLMPGDFLRSPLLPDFSVDVGDFFINLPDPQ